MTACISGPSSQSTWLFAGGGTGGHLFPGIAVAEELLSREPHARVVFAGSGRAIEREIVAAHAYEHHPLPVEPSTTLRRNPVRFAWRNWSAWRRAKALLVQERPAAVIGLGGFASVPVVLAAARLGIPTLLLEQNAVPGRATRWLSRFASRVCLTFPDAGARLSPRAEVRVTGNPVRRRIAGLLEQARDANEPPTLVILGGSQGARAVNDAALATVESLGPALSGWRIVHQTGAAQVHDVRRWYADREGAPRMPGQHTLHAGRAAGTAAVVEAFFDSLDDWYRRADLVVSRAGATTLAELACAGLPAVLVPYPGAADDHQLANARLFESAGAARIVTQHHDPVVTAASLEAALAPLLPDAARRRAMGEAMRGLARPEAAVSVAVELVRLTQAGRHE